MPAAVVAEISGMGGHADVISVSLNKSQIVQLKRPIKKISMGNPTIADIVILKGNQLYVLGKQLGTTNVLMWDKNDQLIKALDIEVHYDLNTLKKKLAILIPQEKVEVYNSQGALVLKGEVSSLANADKALQIARSFVAQALAEKDHDKTGRDLQGGGGDSDSDAEEINQKVINLLTVGGSQQVMIKVTVAEMSRTTAKKLGVKFFAANSDGKWLTGAVNGGGTIGGSDGLHVDSMGLFARYVDDNMLFSMALEAAKENGTAKILAEPTLTALSGQSASFLSGGEFPVPVPQGFDKITIEYKEFGVKVKFLPVVLNSGAINLKLDVSVTELTDVNIIDLGSSNFAIPSLSNRSTSTTVELGDGQTIGLAGLISDNMRSVVTKFPGLGDIPLLGVLFRSQAYEHNETELVILVTPYLAEPINNQLASLPTDVFVSPSDFDFYLLGRPYGSVDDDEEEDEQTPLEDELAPSPVAVDAGGGTQGTFGHSIE
ncbi:MAG: type II and III secretion system protein family protein [Pseudomonadales bacterium]|nr:type II and III secretion system protein family protein [Pseudomonadales bacterium]